ncbi:uncharacterized protein LOC118408649 [Branchiostoma floridae]|uniref:Uncharacterized protein LOC118408649 n=1 Tax=Branchiostoma floridae TaxID=7739 RepID=A0A9J7HW87_BRAFL|nr:uncharacterized protein LOC118408649 [Branchiostoma floridae]
MAHGQYDTNDFLYDAVLFYEKDDPDKRKIEEIRTILESDSWGVNVFDPHRSEDVNKMDTFQQSFRNSRHAIVFLTNTVLRYMEEKKNAEATFRMSTFLCSMLSSHDEKIARRLIPIKLTNDRTTPFLLCDLSVLEPEQAGFRRKLFRCLSVPPGPNTPSQVQAKQKVQEAQQTVVLTDAVVQRLAVQLHVPPEVMADIQQEYGGCKARAMEVVDCWRTRYGEEASMDELTDALRSMARQTLRSTVGAPQQEEPRRQSPVRLQPPEDLPSNVGVPPVASLEADMGILSLDTDQSQRKAAGKEDKKKATSSQRQKEPAL